MCTAVIEVPRDPSGATRILAVRDEDPNRPWDPPGIWWPDTHPGVIGVRDRLANGAWLAAAPSRGIFAVLLNRAPDDGVQPQFSDHVHGPHPLLSRGALVLASAQGETVSDRPGTGHFNLVEVHGSGAQVTSWGGQQVVRTPLAPGVHMIAHQNVDDPSTARIERWLPEFQALAGLPDAKWREEWIALLDRTNELHPDDDRAIIRDNRVHGYPTQSLLVCTAEVRGGSSGSGGSGGSGASGALGVPAVDLQHTLLPSVLR
ncbi:MAG: NRDE family protein [Leucobacter sp.]